MTIEELKSQFKRRWFQTEGP